MSKQPQQSQPSASIKAAFLMWMKGEPFRAVKKKVGKPLMQTFAQLAGTTTFKQAKAARDRQVKQQQKKAGAA